MVTVVAIQIFCDHRVIKGISLEESERKGTVGHSPYKAQTMFVS
jgi:hypothetical protein